MKKIKCEECRDTPRLRHSKSNITKLRTVVEAGNEDNVYKVRLCDRCYNRLPKP